MKRTGGGFRALRGVGVGTPGGVEAAKSPKAAVTKKNVVTLFEWRFVKLCRGK